MLIGEFTHTIDLKKRLAIPSKLRKDLGTKAVITRGLDNCLFIFTQKEWQELAKKISALPFGDKDSRNFSRLILAGASEVSLDSLGRILVPDYLRNYAQLKKNVVIVGLNTRLEVWDKTKWEIFKQQGEKEVDNIAERLGELGI